MLSESAAALAGGITSFMDMPNTNPQTVTLAALENKFALAAERAMANYGFYLGATNDNLSQIQTLKPKSDLRYQGIHGCINRQYAGRQCADVGSYFQRCANPGGNHCEDTPTILRNERKFREKYGEEVPMECHPQIRSAEACYLSSSMAVDLARRHDTRLHLLHLTTARELDLLTAGPLWMRSGLPQRPVCTTSSLMIAITK